MLLLTRCLNKLRKKKMKLTKRLQQRWKEYWCKHFWRPAIRHKCKTGTRYVEESLPVKVCDYCEKAIVLTKEEFYAEFGRMPF